MLADAVRAALPQMRAEAEALMTDACTIVREGEPVYDPDTNEVEVSTEEVYAGRCRVQVTDSLDVRVVDFGGQAVNTSRVTVAIPVGSAQVAPEDVVTITAAAHNDQLVGKVYRVEGAPEKTHATAIRLRCQEVTVP